jgi:D-xylose transport system substrate-binding protein
VKGYQDNTIFKDLSVMADTAAVATASLLEGNGIPADLVNGEIDNDYMMVPAIYLPVNNVTIDNVSDVIDGGLYTWEQACEGAEDEPICQENLG